jgi:hypothetical protein
VTASLKAAAPQASVMSVLGIMEGVMEVSILSTSRVLN